MCVPSTYSEEQEATPMDVLALILGLILGTPADSPEMLFRPTPVAPADPTPSEPQVTPDPECSEPGVICHESGTNNPDNGEESEAAKDSEAKQNSPDLSDPGELPPGFLAPGGDDDTTPTP